jgi:Tfp pilus assembly protein PilN
MTMQRLDLDFCRTRPGSPWAGRLLLAVAAFCLVDATMSYHSARQALKENEARLAKRAPAGRAPKASPQEIAAVRETVQRLSLPWDELFMALESAANDRVALAAIEPDVRAGTVKISGDGKDYLAALSYVANLSRSEGLDRVQLVHHEQKANDPRGPVSFAVSAAWSTR